MMLIRIGPAYYMERKEENRKEKEKNMENSHSIQMTLLKEENGTDQKVIKEKENGKERKERKEDSRQIWNSRPILPLKRCLLITVVPLKRLDKRHIQPKNGRNGLRVWPG